MSDGSILIIQGKANCFHQGIAACFLPCTLHEPADVGAYRSPPRPFSLPLRMKGPCPLEEGGEGFQRATAKPFGRTAVRIPLPGR